MIEAADHVAKCLIGGKDHPQFDQFVEMFKAGQSHPFPEVVERIQKAHENDNRIKHPEVKGECPSCKRRSLFLGTNGYVTCSRLECKDPIAANKLLYDSNQLRGEVLEEAAAKARTVTDGYSADIFEGDFVKDPDGPWVLNSDVAKAIEFLKVDNKKEPCSNCGYPSPTHDNGCVVKPDGAPSKVVEVDTKGERQ